MKALLALLTLATAAGFTWQHHSHRAALADAHGRIAALERTLEDQTLDQSRIHSELATHRAWIRKLTAAREEAPAPAAAPTPAAPAAYQPGLAELEARAEIYRGQSLDFEMRETNRLLREISNGQPLLSTQPASESFGERHVRRISELRGR